MCEFCSDSGVDIPARELSINMEDVSSDAIDTSFDSIDESSFEDVDEDGLDDAISGDMEIEPLDDVSFNSTDESSFEDADEDGLDDVSFDKEKEVTLNEASFDESDKFSFSEEEADSDELMKKVVDQNVQAMRLPSKNGHWVNEDHREDCQWIPDNDAEFSWNQGKDTMTYGDLKAKYGIDGVNYSNNEPDFSSFEDERIRHVEFDGIPGQRLGKDGTYNLATEAAAEQLGWTKQEVQDYMDEHDLTWHECADRKTVRAIPAEINAAFPHTGGISMQNSVNAMATTLDERYGNIRLTRDDLTGKVNIEDVLSAEDGIKNIYRQAKKESMGNGS